jgi:hypothetical protein
MIQTIGIYHIGIPVDDLDRAEGFLHPGSGDESRGPNR